MRRPIPGKGTSCDAPTVSNGRLYGNGVREVANWLRANPNEIVILTMNDYASGHDDHINEPIKEFLGSLVYKPAMKTTSTWPTMQKLLSSGRRIIIFADETYGGEWIFDKGTFNFSTLYPGNSDFMACKDQDGTSVLTRSLDTWLTVGEGRTGADEIDNQGGFLLNEAQVSRALACGYTSIGVDFLLALDAAWPKYRRDTPDLRREASIWSFETDDFGERGPAVMRSSTGRWYSHRATNQHHFACSNGGNVRDKQWKVTTAARTYYEFEPNDPCRAEFGAAWRFDYPANGRQNNDLKTQALGRDAWVKYSVKPVPDVAAAPPYVTVNHTRGAIPAGTDLAFKVYGFKPGTTFSVVVNQPPANGQTQPKWLAVSTRQPNGRDVIDAGGTPLNAAILPAAASLAVGGYDTTVAITYPGGVTSINVHLEVKEPTTIKLTPKFPTVDDGQPVEFYADVAGRHLPDFQDYITGEVVLKALVQDEAGRVVDMRELARGGVNRFGDESLRDGRAVLRPNNMEGGTYKLVAVYLGDGHYASKSTEVIDYVVKPYVTVNRSYIHFTSPGSGPAVRVETNVPTNIVTSSGYNLWNTQKVSDRAADISVKYASAASLPAGTYTALVVATSPVNGRHSHTKVELDVQTMLYANPVQLKFDSRDNTVSHKVILTTGHSPILVDLQAQTADGGTWLKLASASAQAPGFFVVAVNSAGLAAGRYRGTITVSSRLALSSPQINVDLTVSPKTTINTNVGPLAFKAGSTTMNAPATVTWLYGSAQSIGFEKAITIPGVARYTFQRWSDGVLANPRAIVINTPATYTAIFAREYYLSAAAVPAVGGELTITPAAPGLLYAPGTVVQVSAKPKPNWDFIGYSGSLVGLTPTGSVVMSESRSLTAAFRNTATAPVLYASTGGARTDGPGAGQRTVPIQIQNNGAQAGAVQISAITDIAVLAGTGPVTLASQLPLTFGTILTGGPKTANIVLNWPATAQRIRLTIHMRANDGAYVTSTIRTPYALTGC